MSDSIQQIVDKEAPPDMRFPHVSHVVAIAPVGLQDPIGAPFDALGRKALNWHLHKPHPLMPDKLTVLRMYRRATGIKIYSSSNDGKMGVLDFIPMSQVIYVSALMDPAVLIYELGACEAGTDEDSGTDDDDEPDEPDDNEPDSQPSPNGQQTATS